MLTAVGKHAFSGHLMEEASMTPGRQIDSDAEPLQYHLRSSVSVTRLMCGRQLKSDLTSETARHRWLGPRRLVMGQ